MKNTLILGIGNSILSDDAAGLEVIQRLKGTTSAMVKEINSNILDIINEMEGFNHVVIVDSIKTEKGIPGTWCKMQPDDLLDSNMRNSSSTHSMNLPFAIRIAKECGCKLPEKIDIYAIEIKDNHTFAEGCCQAVQQAVQDVSSQILTSLGES
ncbi:MAG: hydrogenase maturation protease [Planctomycetota bacterium]